MDNIQLRINSRSRSRSRSSNNNNNNKNKSSNNNNNNNNRSSNNNNKTTDRQEGRELNMMKRPREVETKRRRRISKRARKDDEKKDRLSDLPDVILLLIMECMNIKEAVQTCVLSKRWKDLWKSLTNLRLHFSDDSNSNSNSYFRSRSMFTRFVSRIMSSCDHSFPLKSLDFKHSGRAKTTLLQVMKSAAMHNVQKLTIFVQFSNLKNDFKLPGSIFSSTSLTSLSVSFRFVSDDRIIFPKSFNMPALQNLHLEYPTFVTGDNGCIDPFSLCKKLNSLLIFCFFLQDGDDAKPLCINNCNLTKLIFGNSCRYDLEAHSYQVELCTPKVTHINILDRFPNHQLSSTCNLPSLEEVDISDIICLTSFLHKGIFLINWLRVLANAKTMIVSLDTLSMVEALSRNSDTAKIHQPPCFVRLTSLKVMGRPTQVLSSVDARRKVEYLLQNSPEAKRRVCY